MVPDSSNSGFPPNWRRGIYLLRDSMDRLFPRGSFRARFAGGVLWSTMGAAAAMALGMLASIVTARILGRTAYGELGMLMSTMGMLGTLGGMGLGLTATKSVADSRSKDPDRCGRVIGLVSISALICGGAVSLAVIPSSPYIADYIINAPHLREEIRIGSALVFFGVLSGVQTGILSGFEAFRAVARVSLVRGIAAFPLIVGGAFLMGLEGAVLGHALAGACGWGLTLIAVRTQRRKERIPVIYQNLCSELPLLWRYSVPALLGAFAVTGGAWMANVILVNQPNGYSEMGVFTAANQWRNALLWFPSVLSQTTVPIMAHALSLGKNKSVVRLLSISMLINSAVVVVPGSLLALLSPTVMAQFGHSFSSGWPTLVACILLACLVAAQSPVGSFIAASGRMWAGLLMNSGWVAVLMCSLWFLRDRGALGLALAHVSAYIAHGLWTFVYAYLSIKDRGGHLH